MKITKGKTTLVVIECEMLHYGDDPQTFIERLCSIVPSHLRLFFAKNFDLSSNGSHAVIFMNDSAVCHEFLTGILMDYLSMACIDEQCNAYDERYLIELLGELGLDSESRKMVDELRGKVDQHCAYATKELGADLLFHKKGNVEFIGLARVG